jgi:hypothetical protein
MNSLYNAVTNFLFIYLFIFFYFIFFFLNKEKEKKEFLACLICVLVTLTQAGNKAVGVMKAGQTFTIEPMINAGILQIVCEHAS